MEYSNEDCDILVIEDDYDIRESMRDALEIEGYNVITANNGKEGMMTLKSKPKTCLVMLDMVMPVMGGREFLDIIVKDKFLSKIPVLVVSSVATKENTLGAAGFLRKPADLDMILKIIKTYCPFPTV